MIRVRFKRNGVEITAVTAEYRHCKGNLMAELEYLNCAKFIHQMFVHGFFTHPSGFHLDILSVWKIHVDFSVSVHVIYLSAYFGLRFPTNFSTKVCD